MRDKVEGKTQRRWTKVMKGERNDDALELRMARLFIITTDMNHLKMYILQLEDES